MLILFSLDADFYSQVCEAPEKQRYFGLESRNASNHAGLRVAQVCDRVPLLRGQLLYTRTLLRYAEAFINSKGKSCTNLT